MSRRNPRRFAAVMASQMMEESNSEEGEDVMESASALLDLMRFALTSTKRRRRSNKCKCKNCKCTTKKTPPKKSSAAAKRQTPVAARGRPKNIAKPTTVSLDSDSCDSTLSETVKENHQKSVQSKVDSFFKSGNLISDDEEDGDDGVPVIKSNSAKKSATASKDFYEIPDSDEEMQMPSTSVTRTVTSVSYSTTTSTAPEPRSSKATDDELMEIVDKILDSSDNVPETVAEPDNWNEFKSKTEELLGSVKSLLGSMNDIKNEPKKSEQKELSPESPVKIKPSCPICLEVLDGDIVPRVTVCGHIFCMGCIMQVAKSTKSCPTCRKKVTVKQVHPIYF